MKQRLIHYQSLALGKMFRTAHWALGSTNPLTEYLLDSYRAKRRQLPGKTKGPGGRSTRYGATEAHKTTQDP